MSNSKIVLFDNNKWVTAQPGDLDNVPTAWVVPLPARSVRLTNIVQAIQVIRNEWESTGQDLTKVFIPVADMLDELTNLLELAGVEDPRGLLGLPSIDVPCELVEVSGWDKELPESTAA